MSSLNTTLNLPLNWQTCQWTPEDTARLCDIYGTRVNIISVVTGGAVIALLSLGGLRYLFQKYAVKLALTEPVKAAALLAADKAADGAQDVCRYIIYAGSLAMMVTL